LTGKREQERTTAAVWRAGASDGSRTGWLVHTAAGVSAFVLAEAPYRFSLLDENGLSRYVRGVAVDIGDLPEPVQVRVEQLVRAVSFRPMI
jgi:hypothetical protein